MIKVLGFLLLSLLVIGGIYLIYKNYSVNSELSKSEDGTAAVISTSQGEIKIQFYSNDAPKTVANFIKLAESGYYDGLTFHRVIKNFMIQGGDPNCTPERSAGPCGAGGPGYRFEDELDPNTPSAKEGYKKGVVAMANAGPNTNGSQFFVMVADVPLPHQYTIFGKVIDGQNVADKISLVSANPQDRPLSPVIIKKITIE